MISLQGHLILWRVLWVPFVLAKNSITKFYLQIDKFWNEALKERYCLLSKISLHSLTASWSEDSSLSSTVQLGFSWFLEMSGPQNDRFARTYDNLNSSLSETWHHPEKVQTLEHFFQDKQILKEEPINFCKLYDNEGTTQLPLRSNYFISPTVWHLVFGLNFMKNILVMMPFHNGL